MHAYQRLSSEPTHSPQLAPTAFVEAARLADTPRLPQLAVPTRRSSGTRCGKASAELVASPAFQLVGPPVLGVSPPSQLHAAWLPPKHARVARLARPPAVSTAPVLHV